MTSINAQSQPDVFETTMVCVVDDVDSPSHRIRGNRKITLLKFPQQDTKLFGFPGFNLRLVIFSVRFRQITLVHSPFVPYIQPQGS